ncbi:MAG: FtsW/RodA/SpoVE family cell cycle protein, partial [Nocardioides sp.]
MNFAARRTTELGLLVLGTMFVVGAYLLATLPDDSPIPTAVGPLLAITVGLPLMMHLAVRRLAPQADGMLLPLAALLNGLGYVFIVRLDEAMPSPEGLAGLQSLWMILGAAAFVVTLMVVRDARKLERYRYTAGFVGLVLLLMPLLPVVGRTINGSRIWVSLGPVNFQPGEFAKICLIVFLAGYLREKREVLAQARLKDLGPLLFIWGGAMAVLVLTNDLGGGLLYFGIFLAMLYVATAQIWFVAAGAAMFVGGAALVYTQVGRVAERVRMWLDPWSDADGGGYQTIQSIYAIANGHFGGTGFGQGTFTDADGNQLIPYVSTDFIYSALAQELGLVGISAFLLVYMLFAARGFRIAMLAQDGFSKLLAVGLTFCFTLQTFIIVGGIVRIIPLT